MGKVALYRKYRSRDFDELIAQDHITKSLETAVENGQVTHAYLFTGPRGVGKTSAARILARRVNDIEPEASAQHLDIIEIDAASNRRIDEVRNLREKVHIAPTNSQYKVYIIDEVHMLTPQAFNALLKTLEEPPEHAIFILATTEPHKLPDTIISRTQRFNFRPIPVPDMHNHLQYIAGEEGIDIEDSALRLIAKSSRGSFRDSISLLDQISNLGDQVTADHIAQVLGYVDQELIVDLLSAVVAGEATKVAKTVQEFWDFGADATQVLEQILELTQAILHAKLEVVPDSYLEQELIDAFSTTELTQMLETFSQLHQNTHHLDLLLEATALRLANQSAPESKKTDKQQLDHKSKQAARQEASQTKNDEQDKDTQNQPDTQSQTNSSTQKLADFDQAKWQQTLGIVKTQNSSVYGLLNTAATKYDDGQSTLVLRFPFKFHQKQLEIDKNRKLVESALEEVFDETIYIKTELDPNAGRNAAGQADDETDEVDAVLNVLGGEVL